MEQRTAGGTTGTGPAHGPHVRVLGPLSVTVDGADAALGGPVPRTLLLRLIMAGGRLVTDDALVDALWPEEPPASAVLTLRGYISSLRKAVEPSRGSRAPAKVIVRQGPGYTLNLPPGAVDADRFTDLAREGRARLDTADPAAAVRLLDDALALWRGPAYADCADRDFARPEVVRLEGLRTGATEDRLAALLDLGDHQRAAAELEAFTRSHPLRERAWELLALALYRAGRQGDALEALATARRGLADELGADPGPGLTRLQASILAQDPALAGPARGSVRGAARDVGNGPAVPSAPSAGALDGTADGAQDRTGAGPVASPGAPPGHLPGGAPAPALEPPADSNLPAPLSPIVGRGGELAAVTRLLGSHRLVTLTGAGGMGKTRLALEAARARDDADGPWLVELAGIDTGTSVAETVAAVLGVAYAGGEAGLLGAMRERRTLLVLDNCEHVVDDAATFAARLLAACPAVRILATSREPLGVDGEQVREVPPLTGGADGEAVALFVARATAVAPGWADDTEPALLARLCAELDGMPLAIELAAAQARVLSARQLAEHLDDRFTLLRGGPRGTARHQTLRAAIDWSYARLDEDERAVFAALAVFRGSFELDAARRVTGRQDVIVPLTGLVAKSLVTVTGGDPRRYRILETLRQYAELHTPAGERAEYTRRLVDWITDLADEAHEALRGPASGAWMTRVRDEMPNINFALDLAAAEGDIATTMRLAAGVSWFWYRHGGISDGLRRLAPVLADPPPDETGAEAATRSRAAVGLAMLHYLRGAHAEGTAALMRANEAAERGNDRATLAHALSLTAFFEAMGGAIEQAREHGIRAVEIAREAGHHRVAADALLGLGNVEGLAGNRELAAAHLDECITEAEKCGHQWALVSAHWYQAKAELADGSPESALRRVPALVTWPYRESDVTSWLVGVTTTAAAILALGHAEEAAELDGIVEHHGERIGYDPAAMDPLVAGYRAGIRAALDDAAYGEAVERVRGLTLAESHDHVMATVARVRPPKPSDSVF